MTQLIGGPWCGHEIGILTTPETVAWGIGQLDQIFFRLRSGVLGHEGGGAGVSSLIPVHLHALKDAHSRSISQAPWGTTGRCFPCFIDV